MDQVSGSFNFNNILAGTRCLPQSFYDVDDFLTTPPRFINLTNQSLCRPDAVINQQASHTWGLNLSSKAAIGTIARFAAAFFMLPIHAAFGTIYHLICAVTRITMGFIEKSRGLPEDAARNDVRQGCIHLANAVYNLATMMLSPLVAIAYAAVPDMVVDFHKKVYSETPAVTQQGAPVMVQGTEVQDQRPVEASYLFQAATAMTDSIMPHTEEQRGFWARITGRAQQQV